MQGYTCVLGNTLPLGVLPWLSSCFWKCGWNIILVPSFTPYHCLSPPELSSACSLSLCLLNLWAQLSWPLTGKMASALKCRKVRIFPHVLIWSRSDSKAPCFTLVGELCGNGPPHTHGLQTETRPASAQHCDRASQRLRGEACLNKRAVGSWNKR